MSGDEPAERRSRRWRRRLKRIVLALLLVSIAAGVLGAVTNSLLERAAFRHYRPPGRMLDVNGHRMHLWCTGQGSPTVVLVSGLGGWSLDWARVQPEVAATSRVCSYDRPGFGWSDPHASTLTPDGIVADLRALLDRGGVRPPYVLVGQSVGGIYSRIFAQRFPNDVAAMVLVDSAHEEQFSRYPNVRHEEERQLRLLRVARYLAPLGVARLIRQPVAETNLPGPLGATARAIGYRTDSYFAFYDEASRLLHATKSMKLPTTRFDVPVVVVTSGDHVKNLADGRQWAALQRELLEISRCASQTIVSNAGHNIQADTPAAVTAAIQTALQKAARRCH